ncbi:MAG: hypothetical protein ACRDTE_31810 [Pseudonocardiaceae bacterium]
MTTRQPAVVLEDLLSMCSVLSRASSGCGASVTTGVEEVLGGGDGCGDFVDVDVFAGKGGVFEFVSTATQCSEPAQWSAELGAYGVADGEVPAGLSGS